MARHKSFKCLALQRDYKDDYEHTVGRIFLVLLRFWIRLLITLFFRFLKIRCTKTYSLRRESAIDGMQRVLQSD